MVPGDLERASVGMSAKSVFALLLLAVVPQLSSSLQLTTLARGVQPFSTLRRCEAAIAALDYKDVRNVDARESDSGDARRVEQSC